ncbi:MAG: thioether cross-link-forming SCIFF peptide maturase [Eubacterium sp.]|nr:thioether cross-link-forming SCIFF peptide maturase [Eubacterium sp.]
MIHKFEQNGRYIVLDVCSGGVHEVDVLTYDLLDYIKPPFADACPAEVIDKLPQYLADELNECYLELKELHEAGMLFTEDDYAQYADMALNAPIKAMCLHVSHDCNLRCKYCFAQTGDFGGDRMLMSPETGKRAMDYLIAHSANRVNLEVDFFGGEPLMAWDTVVETVKYARGIEKQHNKNFRFTITTNGILLDDEKIDFINKEMSNCVLSLDGRKEVNDNIRPCVNGKGSYDVIVPKYKKLVDGRGDKDYYVRGTFTKYNLDFAEDVLHINSLGFEQLSVEPVVADPSLPYAITEADLPRIFDEYDRLERIMEEQKINKDRKFNFFHFMVDLNQGPCVIKRLRGCGCGNEYVAITPDGDIYPCHQFVGIEEWRMGSIFTDELSQEIKNKFAKLHVYSKEQCGDCWARFYCSGGCNANSFIYEGDIRKPHKLACEMQKKRIECAIALASIE